MKRVKMEEKLLWMAYIEVTNALSNSTIPDPLWHPFPKIGVVRNPNPKLQSLLSQERVKLGTANRTEKMLNALHCQVGLASGRSLGRDWRRRPGRPRAQWTDQLRIDTGSVPANLWRQPSYGTMVERRDGPS